MQLRPHRERKNVTLSALAKGVRVSAPYLSQIEAGLRTPSMTTFADLVVHLGLTNDEIGDLVRAQRTREPEDHPVARP